MLSGMWIGVTPIHGCQKDVCLKEIGFRARNMITILGSIVYIIGGGGLYDQLMSTTIFTLTMNRILIWAIKMMRKDRCGFANHLISCLSHVSFPKRSRLETEKLTIQDPSTLHHNLSLWIWTLVWHWQLLCVPCVVVSRICLEGDTSPQNQFLKLPCHCIGSSAHVHMLCFLRWFGVRSSTQNQHTCEVCL